MLSIRSAVHVAALALCTFVPPCVSAQDSEHAAWFPPRTAHGHIPIEQIKLSDGTTRYAIPIVVGERPVLVGLDTGSVGLRLLPKAQSGLISSGIPDSEQFANGVVLGGVFAGGLVTIGHRTGELILQKVTGVSYTSHYDPKKNKLDIGSFGVMGDGLAGEGFEGIMGIRPVPDANPQNPLTQLGAHRWIVSLPQPGATDPGELILDPTPAEMQGFRQLPSGIAPGQVSACLYRPTDALGACGPTTFDTGAPGLTVVNSTLDPDAAAGDTARMVFAEGTPQATAIYLRLDDARQMTHFEVSSVPSVAGTRIKAGVTPYLAYDVLYDADQGTMSVRARDPYPDGPVVHQ